MVDIPLDVKTLIVSQIQTSKHALSTLCLVWPDTIPFVREYRFKDIRIFTREVLTAFIAIVDNAPAISLAIRTMTIECKTSSAYPSTLILRLIASAIYLEHLALGDGDVGMNGDLPASLRSCTRLTTLSLYNTSVEHFSDLSRILQSIPTLTSLKLHAFEVKELTTIATTKWPIITPGPDRPQSLTPWDTNDLESTPEPAPQVTHLELHACRMSEFMFLDLISSSKTPFPYLEEITMSMDSYNSQIHRTQRLSSLMERYNTSLRVLDLAKDTHWPMHDPPLFVLPATVEHYKFTIDAKAPIGLICQALSSARSTLKVITIRLILVDFGLSPDVWFLDDMLAGMSLQRLNLEPKFYRYRCEDTMIMSFPKCMIRYEQCGLAGGIVWR